MQLEIIVSSEISQTQEDEHCMLSHMLNLNLKSYIHMYYFIFVLIYVLVGYKGKKGDHDEGGKNCHGDGNEVICL